MKTLNHRLRDVKHALKGLQASGDLRRKFWRMRLSAALSRLKKQALTEYPGPKVERKAKAPASTRERRLLMAGWEHMTIPRGEFMGACAAAGVRLKTIKHRADTPGSTVTRIYAPGWALKIGPDIPKLTQARLDHQKRKRIVRRIELTKQAEANGVPKEVIKSVVKAAEQQESNDGN